MGEIAYLIMSITCSSHLVAGYPLHSMKSAILIFFRHISGDGMKRLNALICWPHVVSFFFEGIHVVSFGMQIKFDHLIRQLVEIRCLRLHSLWDSFFFQTLGLYFSWDGGSSIYIFCSCMG